MGDMENPDKGRVVGVEDRVPCVLVTLAIEDPGAGAEEDVAALCPPSSELAEQSQVGCRMRSGRAGH